MIGARPAYACDDPTVEIPQPTEPATKLPGSAGFKKQPITYAAVRDSSPDIGCLRGTAECTIEMTTAVEDILAHYLGVIGMAYMAFNKKNESTADLSLENVVRTLCRKSVSGTLKKKHFARYDDLMAHNQFDEAVAQCNTFDDVCRVVGPLYIFGLRAFEIHEPPTTINAILRNVGSSMRVCTFSTQFGLPDAVLYRVEPELCTDTRVVAGAIVAQTPAVPTTASSMVSHMNGKSVYVVFYEYVHMDAMRTWAPRSVAAMRPQMDSLVPTQMLALKLDSEQEHYDRLWLRFVCARTEGSIVIENSMKDLLPHFLVALSECAWVKQMVIIAGCLQHTSLVDSTRTLHDALVNLVACSTDGSLSKLLWYLMYVAALDTEGSRLTFDGDAVCKSARAVNAVLLEAITAATEATKVLVESGTYFDRDDYKTFRANVMPKDHQEDKEVVLNREISLVQCAFEALPKTAHEQFQQEMSAIAFRLGCSLVELLAPARLLDGMRKAIEDNAVTRNAADTLKVLLLFCMEDWHRFVTQELKQ